MRENRPAGREALVLGIETSCDETAAALVTGDRRILAECLISQLAEHRPYGGIVPEIAARAHIEHLDGLVGKAMAKAGRGFGDLDAVAVTAGPGLIGGLLVGLMTAKAIAAASGTPLVAVNHLEAHALSVRLVEDLPFPYLLLLVSGGHTQLLLVEGVGRHRRLGTTIDDAVGEAFDKTAKILRLGYPGGPAIEAAAKEGEEAAIALPRPLLGRPGSDFSFSGLKTAVARIAQTECPPKAADMAASFQCAVGDVLVDRSRNAIQRLAEERRGPAHFVLAGGVAANSYLRARLAAVAAEHGLVFHVPPPRFCTDNGAMVAWAGIERLREGLVDGLDAPARARWPLDPDAPAARGAGVKA